MCKLKNMLHDLIVKRSGKRKGAATKVRGGASESEREGEKQSEKERNQKKRIH